MKYRKFLTFLPLAALLCALVLPAGAAEEVGQFQLAAAGSQHTLAIKEDGTLWGWGSNTMGQVGIDTNRTDCPQPTQILSYVTAVAAGDSHSLAALADGSLWAWGSNTSGQLGLGSQDNSAHPAPAKVMDNVSLVTAGSSHSLAIKTDGSLWAWGANRSGQLGNGQTQDSFAPVKVMDNVTAVAAGEAHTLALKSDGTLWGWGSNLSGQLGAPTQGRSDKDTLGDCVTPMQIMTDVTAISASRSFSMALKSDGTLWVWGSNQYHQLGNGGTGNMAVLLPGATSSFCQTTPVKILENVVSMTAGGSSRACHALALTENGTLWGWGDNHYGQLGNATTQTVSFPTRLNSTAEQIIAGGEHTLIIQNGTLSAWGNNSNGQLGKGALQSNAVTTPTPTPTATPDQSGGSETQISSTPVPTPTPDPYTTQVTAYARTQEVLLDGQPITLQAYALKDSRGYETNYVKLRDAAFVLNGSASQFQISWSSKAGTSLLTNQPYSSNGSELYTPYVGDRQGKSGTASLTINGKSAPLSSILLTDDKGGGYTYFKLRDLGQALNFNVYWDKTRGQVCIQTGVDYEG